VAGVSFSSTIHNGSLWFDSLEESLEPTALDPVPAATDVAIIGGGFTGLWTAYYLKRAEPALDITVFEADTVGFGASGRNGGWCIGAAWGVEQMLRDPRQASRGIALQRALFTAVDEVGRVCQAENIDCHYAKGGSLRVANRSFDAAHQQREVERLHRFGFTEDDYRWLPGDEARGRIGMTPNFGALHARHCAAIQPARLVRGLAASCRRLGVRILERAPVSDYRPGDGQPARVTSARGTVTAGTLIRATEGYTGSISGHARDLLPIYSMMVATQPLSAETWSEIGLHDRETFADDRRVVIYGQRTLDGRLAFGGRAGYEFGSRRRRLISPDDPNLHRVARTLQTLFPQLRDIPISHRWGGVLGMARHGRPCVTFDPKSRIGWAGGYVGEGVAASNLAGRILTDLVLQRTSALTELPWVNDLPRRWEPEPLRWLGVRTVQWLGERADRSERRHDRPSKFWGGLFQRLVG
jgi:glycine/D-amino acid oxidase-like deaminating enzyme